MPKTAEQELLEGSPGHRKINTSAPVADRDIPSPPKWLCKVAARHYCDLVRRIGPKGMRVMAASDRDALAMVCDVYAEYRNCREIIDKVGRYFESGTAVELEDGSSFINNRQIKRHPAVGDSQNAWTRYMTGLGKFGLTPYERQKVSAIGEPDKVETREERLEKRRNNIVDKIKLVQKKAVNA